MYKVTGKKKGILWDNERNKPLAKFVKGEFITEDARIAEKLKDMGYEVEEDFNEKPDEKTQDDADLMVMDVEALKAYAAEKGINIGEATSKNGILKKIKDSQEQKEG